MASHSIKYVALLRGINVGGNTPVPMAQLKRCVEELGLRSVYTYIHSGNVIFSTTTSDAQTLETKLEAALYATFSFRIRVIVRNLAEMEQLIRAIPENWHTTSRKCNVIFLHHTIDTPDIVESFQPKPDIEELVYHPGVLFWAADTGALNRSSMIGLSKSTLYQSMTVRNLNTTRKIYELMQNTL